MTRTDVETLEQELKAALNSIMEVNGTLGGMERRIDTSLKDAKEQMLYTVATDYIDDATVLLNYARMAIENARRALPMELYT